MRSSQLARLLHDIEILVAARLGPGARVRVTPMAAYTDVQILREGKVLARGDAGLIRARLIHSPQLLTPAPPAVDLGAPPALEVVRRLSRGGDRGV